MSQKKVDAYKEQKANRQKIMKKEKMVARIEKAIALVVCIAVVCWVGYSVHYKMTEGPDEEQIVTEMDVTALDEYISGLSAEAAE